MTRPKYKGCLRFVTLLWVVFSLGCSSTQKTQYYMLHSEAANTLVAPDGASGTSQTLGVGPVKVPGYWDNTAVVWFDAPHNIQVPSHHFWAEDIETMMTRVMAQHMRQALPGVQVREFPWGSALRPAQKVAIQIHHIGGGLKGEVQLHMSWQWFNHGDKSAIAAHSGQWAMTSPGGFDGYVKTLNQLLAVASQAVIDSWEPGS